MGKFVKVKCKNCNNEQTVFERPSRNIECLVCEEMLAKSTGGKATFIADVLE